MGEDTDAYIERCKQIVLHWSDEYQKLTGHTVLRSDLHLDEGHVNEAGQVVLNAHAHIMADRTNDEGRVLKINRAEMRKIQDMTAKVSELERGKDARQTRLKHINSHQYKALAEAKRLESQQRAKTGRGAGQKRGAISRATGAHSQQRKRLTSRSASGSKRQGRQPSTSTSNSKRNLRKRSWNLPSSKSRRLSQLTGQISKTS